MDNQVTSAGGAPDLVITNVTIIDAVQGVVKADVGIKDGRICAHRQGRQSADDGRRDARPGMRPRHRRHLRRASDPDRRPASTRTSISFRRSRRMPRCPTARRRLIGGGTGPSDGSNATTVTPGPGNIDNDAARRSRAGRSTSASSARATATARPRWSSRSRPARSASSVTRTGAPRRPCCARALTVADEMDVQVCIHTDTLNESGFVEDTIAAFEGRDDPLVPHRRLRRRPRAGHHQGRGPAQRAARLDQSDAPLRHQLAGRALRHDHGVPPPQPRHPVGRGVHREPHPRRDHRGRKRAARHGRDLDVLERLAGDGPHRRVLAAHASRPPTR